MNERPAGADRWRVRFRVESRGDVKKAEEICKAAVSDAHEVGRSDDLVNLYAPTRRSAEHERAVALRALGRACMKADAKLERWNPGAERWQPAWAPIEPAGRGVEPKLCIDDLRAAVHVEYRSRPDARRAVADLVGRRHAIALSWPAHFDVGFSSMPAARSFAAWFRRRRPDAAVVEVHELDAFHRWWFRERWLGNYAGRTRMRSPTGRWT